MPDLLDDPCYFHPAWLERESLGRSLHVSAAMHHEMRFSHLYSGQPDKLGRRIREAMREPVWYAILLRSGWRCGQRLPNNGMPIELPTEQERLGLQLSYIAVRVCGPVPALESVLERDRVSLWVFVLRKDTWAGRAVRMSWLLHVNVCNWLKLWQIVLLELSSRFSILVLRWVSVGMSQVQWSQVYRVRRGDIIMFGIRPGVCGQVRLLRSDIRVLQECCHLC